MAAGLPIPDRLSKLIKSNKSLLKAGVKIYAPYLKQQVRLKTWYKWDRNNSARLYPFKLLWIPTNQINKRLTDSGLNRTNDYIFPRIKQGNWHNKYEIFEETELYKSMLMRYKNRISWEETPHYQTRVKYIEQNSDKYTYNTSSPKYVKRSLQEIDTLYQNIKTEGYKSREEFSMKQLEDSDNSNNIDQFIPKLREILVSISPEGEILLEDGNHRLAIAKILDIEQIPVRVLVRHLEWQNKRNLAVKSPESLNEELRNHPDIEYLLNQNRFR